MVPIRARLAFAIGAVVAAALTAQPGHPAVGTAHAAPRTPHVLPDEGWLIERLEIRFDLQRDGSIAAREAIDVDFRGLARHGIFRDFRYLVGYSGTHNRRYGIAVQSVTDADGRPHRVQDSTEGALQRLKIGDPDRTISGKTTYRLAYRLTGALNAQPGHDELYWNATGVWPVRVARATVIVTAPAGAIERVACFQGARGSTEACEARLAPRADQATFAATRPLEEGEELSIVAAVRKGTVPAPEPILEPMPREVWQYFDRTPAIMAAAAGGFAVAVFGVAALWWRLGRDRRFVSLHYLTQDPKEEVAPVFGSDPIVVEFEPPEHVKPAQIGLLVDETADTLDVTVTIVDLAVRGYIRITELPKTGWFGKTDWQIDRLKDADGLLEYETIVFSGLFETTSSRTLSDLKNKFHSDLTKAKTALYVDSVDRRWFHRNPNTVRTLTRVAAVAAVVAGVVAVITLGQAWGAGLAGLPIIAGGLLLAIVARAMPRRTARGRELTRRVLGFAKYLKTAEVRQQAFAERANIFTAYLPYAMVFKCVDKWARAFQDIDLQAATAGWYVGSRPFTTAYFSSSLGSFSSSVSSAIVSTPGGSGGSGFSGGSSGGGGGGGGGGSW